MAHYAEAFCPVPGHCFRFVASSVGHASHCQEPVVIRGRFIDGTGKAWHVDACAEHAEDMIEQPAEHDSSPMTTDQRNGTDWWSSAR